MIFAVFKEGGWLDILIESLKFEQKTSVNTSAFFLTTFHFLITCFRCFQFWNFSQDFFFIYLWKIIGQPLVFVAYFSYTQYAGMVSIILRDIQNRISDIASRKFTVWIFCDVKVTFNVQKESIQKFTTIFLVDATLFDKNGLILPRLVNSSGNIESLPVLIHLTKCSSFSSAIACQLSQRNLRFGINFSYF